ncbi:flagellar hook-basal body complex protein FliE [Sandaracinobacteroides saxicola]|uniref:Flagellar hook-basal body complex protein FliE n=1 Tax=Sandaracinobacteroides saxicola TaxID=2759707 RepID=A0A7G5IK05_9SPHN|nr:flagellar hook-basal body complex protein FliE [Sandaracinobacteroides saxicola]QMW23697.1 flagellar hook-basal body complex protein FliE [Sandaracinobacteroides saxicola]
MVESIGTQGISAYASTVGRTISGTAAQTSDAGNAGSFGAMLSGMVDTARAAGVAAEMEGAKSAAGQGDLIATAASFNAAEVALETLVATRDRAVAAFNDIIRMQV